MSVELLKQIAALRLPIDCIDDDLRDGLLVLRSAGLIAALQVRQPTNGQLPELVVVRVLAITPAGRRLLSRAKEPATYTG